MAQGKHVAAYLNAEEKERFEAQVQREGIPQNQILKKALREYMDRQDKEG
jgi:hypothetical protein